MGIALPMAVIVQRSTGSPFMDLHWHPNSPIEQKHAGDVDGPFFPVAELAHTRLH
jgi:hypothetical protein